jgi:hypothetical protein
MEDLITIELPSTTPEEDLKALKDQIQKMGDVEDTGSLGERSIDPVTLGLWIQLATGALGVVSTGVPIIQKIVEMIRGKGIKGVKLTLANGTTVSVDDASAKDLEKLIRVANQPARPKRTKKTK